MHYYTKHIQIHYQIFNDDFCNLKIKQHFGDQILL